MIDGELVEPSEDDVETCDTPSSSSGGCCSPVQEPNTEDVALTVIKEKEVEVELVEPPDNDLEKSDTLTSVKQEMVNPADDRDLRKEEVLFPPDSSNTILMSEVSAPITDPGPVPSQRPDEPVPLTAPVPGTNQGLHDPHHSDELMTSVWSTRPNNSRDNVPV